MRTAFDWSSAFPVVLPAAPESVERTTVSEWVSVWTTPSAVTMSVSTSVCVNVVTAFASPGSVYRSVTRLTRVCGSTIVVPDRPAAMEVAGPERCGVLPEITWEVEPVESPVPRRPAIDVPLPPIEERAEAPPEPPFPPPLGEIGRSRLDATEAAVGFEAETRADMSAEPPEWLGEWLAEMPAAEPLTDFGSIVCAASCERPDHVGDSFLEDEADGAVDCEDELETDWLLSWGVP